MKRIIFSVTGTVLGLVALLSFKSHGTEVGAASGLPTAELPGAAAGTAGPQPASSGAATTPATTSPPTTAGPPQPKTTTPAQPKTTTPAQPTTRTVVGDAIQTQYGVVQVKVTVAGSKISDVGFAQLTAYDGRSQQINSQAAPILLQETLSAQSANIDGVSGASYTSEGYIQSLQSALDKAGVR